MLPRTKGFGSHKTRKCSCLVHLNRLLCHNRLDASRLFALFKDLRASQDSVAPVRSHHIMLMTSTGLGTNRRALDQRDTADYNGLAHCDVSVEEQCGAANTPNCRINSGALSSPLRLPVGEHRPQPFAEVLRSFCSNASNEIHRLTRMVPLSNTTNCRLAV